MPCLSLFRNKHHVVVYGNAFFSCAGYGGRDCKQCAAGTYSEGNTKASCQPCPAGLTSRPGAQSIGECKLVCPAGQGIDPASPTNCSTCLPGTYSTSSTGLFDAGEEAQDVSSVVAALVQALVPACSACPDGYTSAAGSDSVTDCGEETMEPAQCGGNCLQLPYMLFFSLLTTY